MWLLQNDVVFLMFSVLADRDKTEKKLLGMCFVRLITDEFTMLADGSRELCFYKVLLTNILVLVLFVLFFVILS